MAFEKESVGSNSSNSFSGIDHHARPTSTSSSSPPFQSYNYTNSHHRGIMEGSSNVNTCYRCQKQGHWAKDCPTRTPTPKKKPATEPEPGEDGLQYYRQLPCPCGAGSCEEQTSHTVKNPDRKFYCCPSKSNPCGFFKWLDMVRSDEYVYVPMCSCGAGACSVGTEMIGINAGRRFICCPIKKGQGACSFFQWLDSRVMKTNSHVDDKMSSVRSTLTRCNDQGPENIDSADEVELIYERTEIESPAVDTPVNPQNHASISPPTKRVKTVIVEGQEDTSDEPLRKHLKRSRHEDLIADCFVNDSAVESVDMTKTKLKDPLMEERKTEALVLGFETEIRSKQVEFQSQISIEKFTTPACSATSLSGSSALPSNLVPWKQNPFVTAISLNIGLHVQDWWGRLAYPPSRSLTLLTQKPFIFCDFPSFDPIPLQCVTRDSESTAVPPGSLLPAENISLSQVKTFPGRVESTMTGAILDGFAQLAMQFQNKLISHLEFMDVCDHECMMQEASITFAALERLSIDYRAFSERVKDFISSASALAKIERSVCSDLSSSHEVVDQYDCKKKRLDVLYRDHAEVVADLHCSRERLRLLGQEAARVRDMLSSIETELCCCEVDSKVHEAHSDKISKDIVDSEQGLKVASEAAEEAKKLIKQREEERDAAKVTFEKARILLRG